MREARSGATRLLLHTHTVLDNTDPPTTVSGRAANSYNVMAVSETALIPAVGSRSRPETP